MGLPAVRNQELSEKDEKIQDAIANAVFNGVSPAEIAKKLEPTDLRARRRLRAKIKRQMQSDALFQARVVQKAQGQLIQDLGPSVKALGRRASRGRVDAIKLLFEATGFHNPKVKHEHSGDIKVSLNIPRPPVEDDSSVTDVEVVDESG